MQRRVEPRSRGLSFLFTERWCGWEPASGHCKQPIFFPWQKPMLLSRQYHPMSPVGRTSLQFYNLLYQLDIDHHSAVKTSNMVPTCLPQHWKPLCAGLRIAAPESDHSTIKWGGECHRFTIKPESELISSLLNLKVNDFHELKTMAFLYMKKFSSPDNDSNVAKALITLSCSSLA